MRMARLPVGLPVMEVGTYHLKRMMMGLGPCLVKKTSGHSTARLPVVQGGRKPPDADDDKLAPSGQMQTFSLRSTGTNG